jgi:glycosyltransferase involved in cell wall biosynthesis
MVALITEMISPYRIPVFNALSEQLEGRLRVFFLAERVGRAWPVYRSEIAFDYEVLPGVALLPFGPASQPIYLNVPIVARLRKAEVGTVIVGGYNHLEALWAFAYARWKDHPLLLWSESVRALDGGRPVRNAIKRRIVPAFDGYLVPGSRAAEQIVHLGAAPDRVFTALNAVDVGFWSDGATARAAGEAPPRLIFVGRLAHRKGLDVLLEALDEPALRELELDVVGEGPDAATLAASARARGLRARFFGHLDREALRARYAAADVFVFPSRDDPWGMVLNEAMATGCVPVSSSAAGGTHDLVTPEETGVVIPPDDVGALREALRRLIAEPDLRARLSAGALKRARLYTPEASAAGFVSAVEATR